MRPGHVRVHQPVGQLRGDVFRRALYAQPGVVDQHVQPTGSSHHLCYRRMHGSIVGNVHGQQGEPAMAVTYLRLSAGAEHRVARLGQP